MYLLTKECILETLIPENMFEKDVDFILNDFRGRQSFTVFGLIGD